MQQGFVDVAGDDGHALARAAVPYRARQFHPAHAGHVLVGHQQIHRLVVFAEPGQRLIARDEGADPVAMLAQQARRQENQRLVVVHIDHMSPGHRRRVRRCRRQWQTCLDRAGRQRQIDVETGALARCAVHVDGSTVGLDDAVRHRQPQAGPAARCLGGEEGFEDASPGRLVHARAVVGHAQADMRPRRQLAQAQRLRRVDVERAQRHRDLARPAVHGLPGVGAQVHQHLLDLGRIGQHR